jgi:hypothetical protein
MSDFLTSAKLRRFVLTASATTRECMAVMAVVLIAHQNYGKKQPKTKMKTNNLDQEWWEKELEQFNLHDLADGSCCGRHKEIAQNYCKHNKLISFISKVEAKAKEEGRREGAREYSELLLSTLYGEVFKNGVALPSKEDKHV